MTFQKNDQNHTTEAMQFLRHKRRTYNFLKNLSDPSFSLDHLGDFPGAGFKNRAVSLYVVSELDALAGFIYENEQHRTKYNFIKMLIEYTQDDTSSVIFGEKLSKVLKQKSATYKNDSTYKVLNEFSKKIGNLDSNFQQLNEFLKNQRSNQDAVTVRDFVIKNLSDSLYAGAIYEFRCNHVHDFDAAYPSMKDNMRSIDCILDLYDQILTKLESKPKGQIATMYYEYQKKVRGVSEENPQKTGRKTKTVNN